MVAKLTENKRFAIKKLVYKKKIKDKVVFKMQCNVQRNVQCQNLGFMNRMTNTKIDEIRLVIYRELGVK